MIDLDSPDPDWDLAAAHAQATRASRLLKGVKEVERCPCCFRPIEMQPISMCENIKEL
jgi:hypothetical protein